MKHTQKRKFIDVESLGTAFAKSIEKYKKLGEEMDLMRESF